MTKLETLEVLEALLKRFICPLRAAVGDVSEPLGRPALTTPMAPDELALGARTVVLRESYGFAGEHRVQSLLSEVSKTLPVRASAPVRLPAPSPERPAAAATASNAPPLPLLVVYSDERSTKMSTLPAGAPASLLFYDNARRLQARAALQRLELSEPDRRLRWGALSPRQRRAYQSAEPPGQLARSLAESHRTLESAAVGGQAQEGAASFSALVFELQLLELLQLDASAHRRAIFRPLPWRPMGGEGGAGDAPRRWEASWLVP